MRKVLLALMVFMLMFVRVQAQSVNVTYIYDGRVLTLSGTTPAGQGAGVTVLVTKQGFNPQAPDPTKIIGIDQMTAGINGGFIFTMGFGIINDDVEIRVGGNGIDTPALISAHLMTTNATIDEVSNNSVKIGLDVYDLSGDHVTPDNIANSLKVGGNSIAFKIGGKWYDLLNPRADSSAYLVSQNAINETTVHGWVLNKWYVKGFDSPIIFTN